MNLDELYEALQQLNLPKKYPDLTNVKDVNQLLKDLYKLNRGNIILPGIIKQLRSLKDELRKL